MPFNDVYTVSDRAHKAPSVCPVSKTWSTAIVIVSLFGNVHIGAGGVPLSLMLMYGTDCLMRELFKMGRRVLLVNGNPMSVCYFCYQYNNVDYYITARDDNRVVLQKFDGEPENNFKDGRLFEETSVEKTWYQFRSCRTKDLYLSHDRAGFLVRKQKSEEPHSFMFDVMKHDEIQNKSSAV